jgi:hypothetical protein
MSKQPSQGFQTPPLRENSVRKRPASERRIQANRRNALRSTGPKTTRGKRTVARNAIKHGLLAREVVITTGYGEENLEEFHVLIGELCEYYEPIGVVEESLVQTIATSWWRKARVIRAENGEIRKRLDTLAVDKAIRNSDKVNLDLALSAMDLGLFSVDNRGDQKVSTTGRWSTLQAAQSDLRRHHSGLAYLSALLQGAKSEIASDGYMSEWLRKKIFNVFCFWDYLFAHACLYSFCLPEVDTTDKLLRYEAHLERQLYRAMDQLERLQRQRRGENVPPPLNINLGRGR